MRIKKIILGADLRSSFTGLKLQAQNHDIDTEQLRHGDFVFFVNNRKTMLKAVTLGNTILHHKAQSGGLDMRIFQYFHLFFDGQGAIDFKKAEIKALTSNLRTKSNYLERFLPALPTL